MHRLNHHHLATALNLIEQANKTLENLLRVAARRNLIERAARRIYRRNLQLDQHLNNLLHN